MKKIKLTQNKYALVDDENYNYLMQWKWKYHHNGYAVRQGELPKLDGKRQRMFISMHRLINGTPVELETDHINGNKLDNREANLRSCTGKQNSRNKRKRSNTSSKYKGVVWNKRNKKWQAQIKSDSNYKYLGLFENEIEAAKAYNKSAIKYFSEFAYLNKIGGR